MMDKISTSLTTRLICAFLVAASAAAAAAELTQQHELRHCDGYKGKIKAVTDWRYNTNSLSLRLETEKTAITPPWRGIRSGDHILLDLSGISNTVNLVFPVPSYAENQIIPISGLPPTEIKGEQLLPSRLQPRGENKIAATFNTGDSSMAIVNASEIRLEWKQSAPGDIKISVDECSLPTIPALNATGTIQRVNLLEPLQFLSEQKKVTVVFSYSGKSAMPEITDTALYIVPDHGRGYTEATLSGRRTKSTYAISLKLNLTHFALNNQKIKASLTLLDRSLGRPPTAACRGTVTFPQAIE